MKMTLMWWPVSRLKAARQVVGVDQRETPEGLPLSPTRLRQRRSFCVCFNQMGRVPKRCHRCLSLCNVDRLERAFMRCGRTAAVYLNPGVPVGCPPSLLVESLRKLHVREVSRPLSIARHSLIGQHPLGRPPERFCGRCECRRAGRGTLRGFVGVLPLSSRSACPAVALCLPSRPEPREGCRVPCRGGRGGADSRTGAAQV